MRVDKSAIVRVLKDEQTFAAMFIALYGALYVLLQSEDYALLLGALLVFAALTTVMIVTRRLDWSDLALRLRHPRGQ